MSVSQVSVFDFADSNQLDYVSVPFFSNGKALTFEHSIPKCWLTLADASSMRFRWDEVNFNRDGFFAKILPPDVFPLPIELIHSKLVYAVGLDEKDQVEVVASNEAAYKNTLASQFYTPLRQGDGFITKEKKIVPIVTVADCVPIFLYDPVTECFGIVHSGWKGTGIIVEALNLAFKTFGARIEDFSVVIGPHIQNCCYQVEKDRADYFKSAYDDSCVTYRNDGSVFLSLGNANINLLQKAGVAKENILYCKDCTCCDKRFGSFRRETASLPVEMSLQQKQKKFTAMAAFVF
ncbi:MAG: polyphenol oxidase family protein [Spirochaetaceae bacterium]|nr:polyphenol oxidase family protein [Spirochaetaceae bacterium]